MYRGQQPFRYGRLRQRKQAGFVQGRRAALRLRLKLADGLDLVAEEVDAHGPVHLRRVHVQDAAAPGELPGHLDDVHLRVADRAQVVQQRFHVHLFAAAQHLRQPGVERGREQPHARGLDRRDHDAGFAGRDLPQHGGALLLHVRVRRQAFKGQHIVRGQAQHPLRLHRAGQLGGGAQRDLKRLGGLVVRNQHDHRRLRSAREERDVEGARGGGEPGDTTAPTTEAQVPAYAFKTFGVLNVRERIANKGKDHAAFILAEDDATSLTALASACASHVTYARL